MSVWDRVKSWLGGIPPVPPEERAEAPPPRTAAAAPSPSSEGPPSPLEVLGAMATGARPLDEAAAIAAIEAAGDHGQEVGAIERARQILAREPGALAELRLRLAERLLVRGESGSAEVVLQPLVDPPRADHRGAPLPVWMLAAELAELRGDRARARSLYERVVAADFSFPRAKERAARLREVEGPARDGGATLMADGASTRRYRLREELGRGGAGTVFLADEPALDRTVALKVYHRKGRADRERLLVEARNAAALVHPSVVRVLDVDEVLGAIAMEPLLDGSVKGARERGASDEVMRAYLLDVTRAVAFVHRRGVVHCDLKPSNFLVRSFAHRDARCAVLTDFGIARPIGAPPRQIGEGTIGYMSPEQRAGAPAHPSMDVHALGIAVGELCGAHPHLRALASAMCASDPGARPSLADVERALAAPPS